MCVRVSVRVRHNHVRQKQRRRMLTPRDHRHRDSHADLMAGLGKRRRHASEGTGHGRPANHLQGTVVSQSALSSISLRQHTHWHKAEPSSRRFLAFCKVVVATVGRLRHASKRLWRRQKQARHNSSVTRAAQRVDELKSRHRCGARTSAHASTRTAGEAKIDR